MPTPLTRNREPDLNALVSAASGVADVLQPGQLVVLESTTYPGTTRERLVPILEESGMKAGRDFHVAFSPERVDPGRTDHTMRTTPKVVGGLNEADGAHAESLYRLICDDIVRVGSPEAAEMAKLLENIFRSVNIALVNELSILCDRMDIDILEVIDAAATKPYGFMRFDPGPGMGGHCLPVDPFYLTWKAREYDLATEFIELAGKVNSQMPSYCTARIERALNDLRKPVNGTNILLLGMSYKAGVGDVRESPAITIAEHLQALHADLSYHDPYVPEVPELGLRSVELGPAVEQAELVVILTAHPGRRPLGGRGGRASCYRLPRGPSSSAQGTGSRAARLTSDSDDGGVRLMEGDDVAQDLVERPRGLPVDGTTDLRDVRVAARHVLEARFVRVVIGDHVDLGVRAGHLTHAVGETEHRDLLLRADVEHLAVGGLAQLHEVDERTHDVVDVTEAARLRPVAEDGDRAARRALAARTSGRPCRSVRSDAGRRC